VVAVKTKLIIVAKTTTTFHQSKPMNAILTKYNS